MKTEYEFGLRREAKRHAAFERTKRVDQSTRPDRPKAVSPLRFATALQNFAALLLCVFALIPSAVQAQTNNLTVLLQQGLFEEQANRNLDAAIASYQSLAAQFDKDRQLAATAVFRLGECYRALGKTNEAAAQYQRILKDFSDEQTLATLSRQNLTGMGMAASTGTTSSTAGIARQKELLGEEIKLFERQLATQQGVATPGEMLPDGTLPTLSTQQKLLELKRQLAALDSNRADLVDLNVPTTSEEDQEIQRIQQMIQNSPDLINAPSVGANGNLTPLENAASHGWLKVAPYLLDHGADVNARGGNALFEATKAGNRAMVELLLSRGANVNANQSDSQRNTPLHIAAGNGFQAVVEVLLANKADVNAQNSQGNTPLIVAARMSNPKILSLLLGHKADVNTPGNDGGTPLILAAAATQLENVKLLLAAGANPNVINGANPTAVNNGERTPLSFAAERGSPEMVKILLAAKADPNGGKLDAPLFCAINRHDAGVAELLLQAGANPNAAGGINFLSKPVFRIGQFLQPAGGGRGGFGNVGYADSTRSVTPLGFAISENQLPIVQLLLKYKADPNDSQTDGKPLLFSALSDTNMLEALLKAGTKVDPTLSDVRGWTPLAAAITQNNPVATAILLQHGANPNARSKNGMTPLHWAADSFSPVLNVNSNIFELLLTNKADPNVRDNNGQTPLDMFKKFHLPPDDSKPVNELADLLRQHGALDKLPDWDRITVSRPSANFSQMVFKKGTNDWNQFTLLETICAFDQNDSQTPSGLAFADLSHIVIVRPTTNGATAKRIEVNLLNATNGLDCAKDIPLEFGDVVEIPEREHTLAEPGFYLPKDQFMAIYNYLRNKAGEAKLIVAGGRTIQLPLQEFFCRIDEVLARNVARSVLTSSSDLSRVKVTRRDAKTGKTREWTVDCSDHQLSANGNLEINNNGVSGGLILMAVDPVFNRSNPQSSPDLWLRDGDVIEVPEKP